MDFKSKVGSGYWSLSSILVVWWSIERLVGLAGFSDDIQAWRGVINMIPDTVAAAAATVFVLFAWARWWDAVKARIVSLFDRIKDWEGWAPIFTVIFSAAALLAILFAISHFLSENGSDEWMHPSLSSSEQKKIRAECEMRAYQATSGGSRGFRSDLALDRFYRACLISEDFIPRQTDDANR